MQALPDKLPLEQILLIHAPLAQVPLIQAPSAGLLEKKASKFVSPDRETVTPNKNVNSKEVSSSTQVFDSHFVNKIKDPWTDKAYDKNCPVMQAYNNKKKNLVLTQLPII